MVVRKNTQFPLGFAPRLQETLFRRISHKRTDTTHNPLEAKRKRQNSLRSTLGNDIYEIRPRKDGVTLI